MILIIIQTFSEVASVKEWSIITLLVFAVLYLWRENKSKDAIITSKDARIREVIQNHMKDKDAHTNKIELVTKSAYEQVKDIITDLKGILDK